MCSSPRSYSRVLTVHKSLNSASSPRRHNVDIQRTAPCGGSCSIQHPLGRNAGGACRLLPHLDLDRPSDRDGESELK